MKSLTSILTLLMNNFMAMKTFKIIGMALVAVLLCVNFTACGNDDEPDTDNGGTAGKEKKLVKLIAEDQDANAVFTFSYDDKGRLVAATVDCVDRNNESSIENHNYLWTSDEIVTETNRYELKDGLIKKRDYISRNENREYEYNSSKQLTAICFEPGPYQFSSSLCWTGSKLTGVEFDNYWEPWEIDYSNETCKKFFPLWMLILDYENWNRDLSDYFFKTFGGSTFPLSVVHPELFGLQVSQLPREARNDSDFGKDEDLSKIFSYSFTADRYIEKCLMSSEYGIISFSFEWE